MSETRHAQPHDLRIIVALGVGDVDDMMLTAAIKSCPVIAHLPRRKVVLACINLPPEDEKALLSSEGKPNAETLLAHVIKNLRRLDLQKSGSGEESTDYPIPLSN